MMLISRIISQLKKVLLPLPLCLGLLVVSLSGCYNDDDLYFMEGQYRGTHTLTRNFGTDSSATTQDSLIFILGRGFVRSHFESLGVRGDDNLEYYYNGTLLYAGGRPILTSSGGGEYSSDGNRINLHDTVMHTALYDGSVIIQGSFSIFYDGHNLILTQNDINNKSFHKLSLTREAS